MSIEMNNFDFWDEDTRSNAKKVALVKRVHKERLILRRYLIVFKCLIDVENLILVWL